MLVATSCSPARADGGGLPRRAPRCPSGDEDGPALVERRSGPRLDPVAAVWDNLGVDWARFELVVLRSTWDYAERRDEFLAWVGAFHAC